MKDIYPIKSEKIIIIARINAASAFDLLCSILITSLRRITQQCGIIRRIAFIVIDIFVFVQV